MVGRTLLACIALIAFCAPVHAESPAERLLKKPDEWFRSDAGRETMENLLSWQTGHGDWPKNLDTTGSRGGKGRKQAGTFDNGATTGELRALARAIRVTGEERYQRAFLRGFDHILEAQYENGGWPQFYPLSDEYHRHITFNDGTMVRLIEFLRDATNHEDYAFLDQDRRTAAGKAVHRGIDCIVLCQVVVDGERTVWCAQHHAETLVPVKARSYELPSLSGAESAGILMLLMSLKQPSSEVVRAVEAGVAWFDAVQIEGYRYLKGRTGPALAADADATPLWARFYEIGTNRPIFADRDGVVEYDLEQISGERRGGYAWYGNWGSKVLKRYGEWHDRFSQGPIPR